VAGFKSLFGQLGNPDDFSPEAWRDSFTSAAEPLWEKELDPVLIYAAGDTTEFWLLMNWKKGAGLSIDYWHKAALSHPISRYISQAGSELASEFVETENGVTAPAGSFLPWDRAWLVVRDFLRAPEVLPASVPWTDTKTLDWPDPYPEDEDDGEEEL